jgi:hypothetical protein
MAELNMLFLAQGQNGADKTRFLASLEKPL